MARLLVVLDHDEDPKTITLTRDFCASLASQLGESVSLAYVDASLLDDLRGWVVLKTNGTGIVSIQPAPAAEVA